MQNFVEIGQTAAEIWQFFDFSSWRPPPSWIFKISNLMVGHLKRAELRRRAKFGQNWSNVGRDMAILGLSRWRPPPSWIFKISIFQQSYGSSGTKCIAVPNFAEIGQTVAQIL